MGNVNMGLRDKVICKIKKALEEISEINDLKFKNYFILHKLGFDNKETCCKIEEDLVLEECILNHNIRLNNVLNSDITKRLEILNNALSGTWRFNEKGEVGLYTKDSKVVLCSLKFGEDINWSLYKDDEEYEELLEKLK